MRHRLEASSLVGRGRISPILRAICLAFWTLLVGSPALAAPQDEKAQKLDEDAISNDYLTMKFADADRKLRQAIAICGSTGCSPNVLAQVHRDLGIVYVITSRVDQGKAQFVLALQIDATTVIPKDLTTPEISAAFTEAAEQAGIAKPVPEEPKHQKPPPAPAPAPPSPAAPEDEDIRHTPPEEGATLTAIPIFVRLAEGLSPEKVVVRYKAYGATAFKSAQLKRSRRGYGIEIPCTEVGSTIGDFRYYIQAIGPTGEVLASKGSKTAPLRIPIRAELTGEPLHLPGRPPPTRCTGSNATECPPEFPGCTLSKRGTGKACAADEECPSGICGGGRCVMEDEAQASKQKCETDRECGGGHVCKNGFCEANPKKNWISIAAQQDLVLLPAARNVCLNGTVYSCVQGDGSYYPARNPATIPDVNDEVKSTVATGTTRILLAYDRPVSDNFALGGRLGYAFGGGPTSPSGSAFLPVHVEGRVSFWFGSEPFIRTGFRPYMVLSFGVAQIDASASVTVQEMTQTGTLIAWKRTGALFAGGGLGMFMAIGRSTGFFAEVRGQQMFPNVGLAIPIQIGYAVGI